MRLLTICPTRNRIQLFREMYDSFKTTSSSAMIVALDEDDPQFEEYKDFLTENHQPFFECMPDTVTNHFNMCYRCLPNYDFYHLTNDDVLYSTKDWDVKAMNLLTEKGGGIAYGNDMLQGQNLPTFPIISKAVVDAVGWIQEPGLERLCGDCVWNEIGRMAKCLHYMPDLLIEHRHWLNNKRGNDMPDYTEVYLRDRMKFANWLANNSVEDIRKVRKVTNGYKSDSIVS